MPDRTPRPTSLCGWIASLGLVSLACSLSLSAPSGGSELRRTPIVKAVERARPSVVNIRGEKTVTAADSQSGRVESGRRVNGMGTGVVIDPRGYVITNYHVIDGVRQIQITMADGRQSTAKLIARDPETDLAIIKLNVATKVPVISLGTSSDLMPGETVVAVGNAYGYEHTVTRGIISALHREVQVSDAQFYDDLIQTDASINPGNSGGPLLNIDGEMIGINVAVRAGAQGIGFAIPADKAVAVAAKLLADYSEKQTWHGVVLATGSGLSDEGGLVVASVDKRSPAAEGGLRSGDAITAVGDLETRRDLDFYRGMLERRAGEKVQLAIRRGGDSMTMQLTLANLPKKLKPPAYPAWETLGLELKSIATKEFRRRYQTRYRGGLSVISVRRDSPAAKQGIRRGDVLVGMHIWETVSIENVSYILNRPDLSNLNPIKFFILRGSETLYGYMPVVAKTARRR